MYRLIDLPRRLALSNGVVATGGLDRHAWPGLACAICSTAGPREAALGIRLTDADSVQHDLLEMAAQAVGAVLDPAGTSTDDLLDLLEASFGDRSVSEILQQASLNVAPMPASMLRQLAVVWSRAWDNGGALSLLNLIDVPAVAGGDEPVLTLAVQALMELAVRTRPELAVLHTDLNALLSQLAAAVEDEHPRSAVGVLVAAAQLTTSREQVDDLVRRAGEISGKAGAGDLLETVALLRLSVVTSRADASDAVSRLAVLDALDATLRCLRGRGNPADPRAAPIGRAVDVAGLSEVFAVHIARWFEPLPDDADDEHSPDALTLFTSPRWGLALPELVQAFPRLAAVAVTLERQRAALIPQPTMEAAHASWADWSFRTPTYESAVPHGTSFLREQDLDALRLLLHHETVHVLSMIGGIGFAVVALRAAAMEVELGLLAMTVPNDVASWIERGIAHLDEPSLAQLGMAERSAELLAKMRALQDVWNPWFEGLAVFAELAEDPRPDDVTTPTTEILAQLIDIAPDNEAHAHRPAQLMDLLREQELAFAQAQERLGPDRLRGYLSSFGPKYLAGYLAVRVVVATWRERVPGLSGSQATRLLLGAMRYGSFEEAVPELGLPLGEFVPAAEAAMTRWVEQLAGLPAEQVRLGSTATTPLRWRGGRMVDGSTDPETRDEVREAFQASVLQALSTLRGDRAPLDRVAGADERTRLYLKAVAEKLASVDLGTYLADHLFEDWMRQMGVLPLGSTTARFWLNEPTRHLVYVVRVNDRRVKDGRPGFDLSTVPLDEEAFSSLVAAAAGRPFDRLTVTRYGDLAARSDDRGLGRNVLVFRLGEWAYVQPRGWAFGASEAAPSLRWCVLAREEPSAVLRMEARLLADDGAASRTARYTAPERRNQWAQAGASVLPWVDHVHRLAQSAASLDGCERERSAAVALLERVLANRDLAVRAVDGGAGMLAKVSVRESFFELLFRSGPAPCTGPPPGLAVPEPDGPVLRFKDCRWDVRPLSEGAP